MAKQKINIDGTTIGIDKNGFISLTDIAKRRQDSEPRFIIRSWFKNTNTLQFLETWETLENANFKRDQMVTFKMEMLDNSITPNISNYIAQTGATSGQLILLLKRLFILTIHSTLQFFNIFLSGLLPFSFCMYFVNQIVKPNKMVSSMFTSLMITQ